MRISLFAATFFFFISCCSPVLAQPSPYGSFDGNVGTWGWGKSPAKQADKMEEHEPGETSWERLDAERQAERVEPEDQPHAELLKTLSPWRLWRLFRGKHNEQSEEHIETPPTGEASEPLPSDPLEEITPPAKSAVEE
jgi:hypothetical protein